MGNIVTTTTTPQKLIFLDIDGVLNNAGSDITQKYVIEQDLIEKLKQIVESVPGCAIVLSSTWKFKQVSRQIVVDSFNSYQIPPYISSTPICQTNRVDEIAYWLFCNTDVEHVRLNHCFPNPDSIVKDLEFPIEEYMMKKPLRDVTHFIVIDDTDLTRDKSEFTQFISERFVHVNRKTGLSDLDVTKSINLLMNVK